MGPHPGRAMHVRNQLKTKPMEEMEMCRWLITMDSMLEAVFKSVRAYKPVTSDNQGHG